MKPDILKPILENIPSELQAIPQWVNWRAVWLEKKEKYNKPPIDPKNLKLASSVDPSTWASFETACRTWEREKLAGLGFVLTEGDSFVGIDIDHCIVDGQISAEAQAIIDSFSSYTEKSPSGHGIRIFVRGKLLAGGRKKGNIEIYDRGRYLTVTGHSIHNEPWPIADRQLEIDSLYKELSPVKKVPTAPLFVPSADNFDMRKFAHCLEGYHESTGRGRARCPAHQGEGTSSFHVDLATGAYGCFKGCTPEAIRAAIGHPKPKGIGGTFIEPPIEDVPVPPDEYTRILFSNPDRKNARTWVGEDVSLVHLATSCYLTALGGPPAYQMICTIAGLAHGAAGAFKCADIELAQIIYPDSDATDQSLQKRVSRDRKDLIEWQTLHKITILSYTQGDQTRDQKTGKLVNHTTEWECPQLPNIVQILNDAQLEHDYDSDPRRAIQRVAEAVARVERLKMPTAGKRTRRPRSRLGLDWCLKMALGFIRKACAQSGLSLDDVFERLRTLENTQVVDSKEESPSDILSPPPPLNGNSKPPTLSPMKILRRGTNLSPPPRKRSDDDIYSWEASVEANE